MDYEKIVNAHIGFQSPEKWSNVHQTSALAVPAIFILWARFILSCNVNVRVLHLDKRLDIMPHPAHPCKHGPWEPPIQKHENNQWKLTKNRPLSLFILLRYCKEICSNSKILLISFLFITKTNLNFEKTNVLQKNEKLLWISRSILNHPDFHDPRYEWKKKLRMKCYFMFQSSQY